MAVDDRKVVVVVVVSITSGCDTITSVELMTSFGDSEGDEQSPPRPPRRLLQAIRTSGMCSVCL